MLKRDGVLSFSDHRMREREIMAEVTKGQTRRGRPEGSRSGEVSNSPEPPGLGVVFNNSDSNRCLGGSSVIRISILLL